MRNIINISLPEEMTKIIKAEVKKGHYATTSEFFRHLFRVWNNHLVAEEIAESEKDFLSGNYKELHSLKDLR